MNLLITLCARGGSKGIPGKNIKPINGKPLIALSIETAKRYSEIVGADIALSTDDNQIMNVASTYGVQTTYIRPEWLATDEAGKIDTIKDLLEFEEQTRQKKYDYILDLDITSPFRTISDLESALKIISEDPKALNLFSVNIAGRNPYFNMVEKQENGFYGLIKNGSFLTRQSAPDVYELNASFYFYKRQFFDLADRKVINEFSTIYIMPHICFDLDHIIDFDFMEYLLLTNKLGFKL